MTERGEKYEHAKEIAKNKISFIRHFLTYVFVLIVLAIINNVTSPRGYQWWLWVALFWGVGLFFNFMNAYVFKGGGLKKLEEGLIRKEIERMKDE